MDIGIDKISFFTPHTYLDMERLAEARDVDPGKYLVGIGQEKQAVAPLSQDAVSMAANAALNILDEEDREKIDYVLFGSESGVDHSKSGAVWLHKLAGIKPNSRSIELKHACYAATAGLQMALGHIALNPDSKVLVVGSDIAKYGLETGGEPTQGAGAVAMVVSANPRVLTIHNDAVSLSKEISDFWRPLYSDYAYVDGKFSNEAYIDFFTEVYEKYKEDHGKELADFENIVFHTPYTKMGIKAIRKLAEYEPEADTERLFNHADASLKYNRLIGNIYTGSLYLSLLSFLENSEGLKGGETIGLFSYGSGAVGEFFSGTLKEGFQNHLYKDKHQDLLENRRELSIEEYEEILQSSLPKDGADVETDLKDAKSGDVVLAGLKDHIRQYKQI